MSGWGRTIGGGAASLALALGAFAGPGLAAGRRQSLPIAPSITLRALHAAVKSGHGAGLAGRVSDPLGHRTVDIIASRFPYRRSAKVLTVTAEADGTFTVRVVPSLDTRYQAVLEGTSATSPDVLVQAFDTVHIVVRNLPLGRAGVTIRLAHPRDINWGNARVDWSFATGRRGRFLAARSTRSLESGHRTTVLRTVATLPAGPFRFRVCFNPHAAGALLDRHTPPGCPGRGYQGGGALPSGYPSATAIAAAERYLAGRIGRTALAVVDSEDRMSGVHLHRTFVTGSVVKAMLLVAYLRRLADEGRRTIDPNSASFLYPMIHISDNSAATETWSIVGDPALYRLARRAGMTDFSISGDWATAQLSAADQARYFFEMDSLIPRQFVGYARFLLSTIDPSQAWGIPAVARPHHYQVFWKAGWRPTGRGQLVHQIARLERRDHTFSMAVMTDGDPSMGYGINTIQGVTRVLLDTR